MTNLNSPAWRFLNVARLLLLDQATTSDLDLVLRAGLHVSDLLEGRTVLNVMHLAD